MARYVTSDIPSNFVPHVGENFCLIVLGLCFDRNKNLLITQESKQSCYGQYFFPTGRVEAGETLIEAVKREVLEETGLIYEPKNLFLVDTHGFSWIRFCFLGDIIGGEMIYKVSGYILDIDDIFKYIPMWLRHLLENKCKRDSLICRNNQCSLKTCPDKESLKGAWISIDTLEKAESDYFSKSHSNDDDDNNNKYQSEIILRAPMLRVVNLGLQFSLKSNMSNSLKADILPQNMNNLINHDCILYRLMVIWSDVDFKSKLAENVDKQSKYILISNESSDLYLPTIRVNSMSPKDVLDYFLSFLFPQYKCFQSGSTDHFNKDKVFCWEKHFIHLLSVSYLSKKRILNKKITSSESLILILRIFMHSENQLKMTSTSLSKPKPMDKFRWINLNCLDKLIQNNIDEIDLSQLYKLADRQTLLPQFKL